MAVHFPRFLVFDVPMVIVVDKFDAGPSSVKYGLVIKHEQCARFGFPVSQM